METTLSTRFPAAMRRLTLPALAAAVSRPGRLPSLGVVKLSGGEVKTEARCDLLYPYRHWITLEDVEFLTFSAEPILLPGTITPGYALRLT